MNDFLDGLMKHWPLALLIGNLLLTWLLWTARRHFASRAEVASALAEVHAARDSLGKIAREADGRLDILERNYAVLDSRVEALPSRVDWERLDGSIGRVSGEVQANGARLQSLERNMHLLLKCQMEGANA